MAVRQSPTNLVLDDWEEVNENFSVMSLSSSDDEEDVPPAASSSTAPRGAPPGYTEAGANETPRSLPRLDRTQWASSEDVGETCTPRDGARPSTSVGTEQAPDRVYRPLARPHTPPSGYLATKIAMTVGVRQSLFPLETGACENAGGYREHTTAAAVSPEDYNSKRLEWLGRPLRHQSSSLPVPPNPNEGTRGSCESANDGEAEEDMFWVQRRLTKARNAQEDEESLNKPEGTLGETLDLDDSSMNPVLISQALESLYEYITDTLKLTDRLLVGLNKCLGITSSCHALLAQITELRPILAEYAAQWENPLGAKDIPLDPSLSLWVSSLRTIFRKLRRQSRLWRGLVNTEEGKEARSALAKLDDALEKHMKQMNDFLPIIQVDFSDYRTQNMTFPTEEMDEAHMSPKLAGNIPPRPTDRLSQIRNAMYRLKDQLQKTVEVLAISQNFLPAVASGSASDTVRRLGSTSNAVSLALTNNGSEWLESDLGRAQIGLLSHAEFSNLDPKTLDGLRVRLLQICNLVSNPTGHGQWSDDMMRDHYVYMLVEQQQLDALVSIASVLEDLMMPKHMKTRTEFDDFMKDM
ncbi:hypothetical protein CTA2_5493 [Colletotrichum tanaceti]|uniref:Uncharacterized protein n=1 Tax=Colletotrichum tanaceti TaxID=1306861 RepID=A0A4U6X8U6_9PEZI|nr:hypothetical protein CTA2_5496 [Colletotrichum tanaceti]KAJ0166875.1 hypothetical protein CTA2_5493 [Colletotrichum tanaceti]TKW51991.1 hypothetical protein CTA1_11035 [Colletotrichum tanaceti]